MTQTDAGVVRKQILVQAYKSVKRNKGAAGVEGQSIVRRFSPRRIRKLTNGLRGLRIWSDDWKVPTPSAISPVRQTIVDIHEQKLPKRRFRSCPRVVRRITIRNTNVKHAHHKIIKYDAAAEIFVLNRPAA